MRSSRCDLSFYATINICIWVYLFEHDDKKYLLVATDYFGDYEFDVFPHLLKYDDNAFRKIDFVLQREIPIKDGFLREQASGTLLFEYTD